MAVKAGYECWLGYSATESGTYSKIAYVRDNSDEINADEIDLTSRDSSGWKAARAGLRSATISFDVIRDLGNSTWLALRNYAQAGTTFYVRVLDGAAGDGIQLPVFITSFSDGEPLGDSATTSISLSKGVGEVKKVTSGTATSF